MKTKNGVILLIVVVVLAAAALYGISMNERGKSREALAGRILSASAGAPPGTVEELKAAIAAYEKQIEKHVEDAAKTATYWKILAVRLRDRGLHGEALAALERGLYYAPEDPVLHYYTGNSAGIMAKSFHIFPGNPNTERNSYTGLAEESFLRAVELDSRYLLPRYGLGVLYTFDLERPEDAVPHLEKCLEISRNDVDAMFVLARAFFMMRNYRASVELYDRIISVTKDEQKKIDAQNNRQTAMGHIYG